jgi:hypothetical protein
MQALMYYLSASITSSATFTISDKRLITQVPCGSVPQTLLPEEADYRGWPTL